MLIMEKISVVIPAYRSKDSIPILIERIENTLRGQFDYEIIVVDDGSPDDTWAVLKTLQAQRKTMKIVRLLRNSGQHSAILCGFSLAKGDVIITMDDDLQNLPEDIPRLIGAIQEGYDLAIGAYDNKQHAKWRNMGGRLVDTVQRYIFHLPPNFQLTSFRAVRKVVVEHVLSMGAVFPYITSMLLSHTARYVNVPVHHEARHFGVSNYTVKSSLRLVCNLLFGYSPYPLYFISALCILMLGLTSILSIYIVWKTLMAGSSVPGWASTITAIAFFNGLTLIALVINSLYLSRLHQQIARSRVSFSIGEIHA
jgi:glycosyltransferase involved in cell wall biosynthesis